MDSRVTGRPRDEYTVGERDIVANGWTWTGCEPYGNKGPLRRPRSTPAHGFMQSRSPQTEQADAMILWTSHNETVWEPVWLDRWGWFQLGEIIQNGMRWCTEFENVAHWDSRLVGRVHGPGDYATAEGLTRPMEVDNAGFRRPAPESHQ